MYDFLFEGGLALYIALALAGLFFLILWVRLRDRRWLVAAGVVAGLALLVFLLDLLRETDRERALRTLNVAIDRINSKDLYAAIAELADDFRAYGMNKQQMRQMADKAINSYGV